MFERGRLEFSTDIVGTSSLRIGGRDSNDPGGSRKEAVDVTDLDGVPNRNAGEALRDVKVYPSARCQASEGRQHFAKAHQVADPLGVDTHRAGKGRAHCHPAQPRL